MVVGNIMGTDFIWVVVIAVVVIFGGSQLPKIARNIGVAGKEFRKAQQESEAEDQARAAAPSPAPAVQPAPPIAAVPAVTAPASVPPAAAAVAVPQTPAGEVPAAPRTPGSGVDDRVNLSRGELDALLADRERQVRAETEGPTA
jgi:sec-independent protein translocase protein TatA